VSSHDTARSNTPDRASHRLDAAQRAIELARGADHPGALRCEESPSPVRDTANVPGGSALAAHGAVPVILGGCAAQ